MRRGGSCRNDQRASVVSPGGQEIPLLPLQVRALDPRGFGEGGVHLKHKKKLNGDIQTHMGVGGLVPLIYT